MTQTATIRITNGLIQLPREWASELDGKEASLTKVDKVLLVTPKTPQYELYADEDIAAWRKEDMLDEDTKAKVNSLLKST